MCHQSAGTYRNMPRQPLPTARQAVKGVSLAADSAWAADNRLLSVAYMTIYMNWTTRRIRSRLAVRCLQDLKCAIERSEPAGGAVPSRAW